MQDETLKTCPTCKEPKDAKTEYYTNSGTGKPCRTCITCFNTSRAKRRLGRPERFMLQAARHRAKRDSVPCTITAKDIKIPKKCPILGIPLEQKTGSKGGSPNSPSLDKIIPALGYTPGNVLVMSNKANAMKQDATLEELVMLGTWARKELAKRKGNDYNVIPFPERNDYSVNSAPQSLLSDTTSTEHIETESDSLRIA